MRRLFALIVVCLLGYGAWTWWTKYRSPESPLSASIEKASPLLENPVADIPAKLSTMRPDVAAAEVWLDDRLLTRFDTAGPTTIECDEGFGAHALLAADARVIEVDSGPAEKRVARVELVSVGQANIVSKDCEVSAVNLVDSVRTDTVRLYVERAGNGWAVPENQTFRERFNNAPLAAPADFYGKSTANWSALYARVDSIRRARGKDVARPRTLAAGHRDGPAVPYPVDNAGCLAAGPIPAAGGRADFAYVHPTEYTPNQISGTWYRIYETAKAPGHTCIAPVRVLDGFIGSQITCSRPGLTPVPIYLPRPEGMERDALLLARDVPGIRAGLAQASFSIQEIDAWKSGVMVYSDSSEVMRVVETGPEGSEAATGYHLSVLYKGRRVPLMWSEASRPETWGLVWVGLLNGDNVPDLVVRTTGERTSETTGAYTEYGLTLFLSAPGPLWAPVKTVSLADC
jgi:hypothetical protein